MSDARMVAIALVLGATACSSGPTDETPSGTVRLFLDAMARSERDPAALRDAYRLLSAPSRHALQQRAHVAVQVGAVDVEPWDMIARSRYRQSFPIREGGRGMTASIDGDRATVTVESADRRRTAEVPLVREDGRWRVDLGLGPLTPR